MAVGILAPGGGTAQIAEILVRDGPTAGDTAIVTSVLNVPAGTLTQDPLGEAKLDVPTHPELAAAIAAAVDVQVFDVAPATPASATPDAQDAAHTWTKPAGAHRVRFEYYPAGGGGGSGRKGAAGTARTGGGGGGGATIGENEYSAADLPASLTIKLGIGGAGGAAVTTDDTDGNAGVRGGATEAYDPIGDVYFATSGTNSPSNTAHCGGGGGGGGKAATAAASGTTGYTLNARSQMTGNGAGSSASGAAGSGGGLASSGGSSGGGITTGNVASAGGVSEAPCKLPIANVPICTHGLGLAVGADGGASSTTGNAADGANATMPGGGGGGGGAAVNATGNSGKGGDGAHGRMVVISW